MWIWVGGELEGNVISGLCQTTLFAACGPVGIETDCEKDRYPPFLSLPVLCWVCVCKGEYECARAWVRECECVFECVCVCVRGCPASARFPGAETRVSWGDRGGFPTQRDLRAAAAVAGDASRTP